MPAFRIPYGSMSAAENTLDEFYRQLGEAEKRRDDARARVVMWDEANPDYWDLIDNCRQDEDDASDEIAGIEDTIDGLAADMRRAFRWRD